MTAGPTTGIDARLGDADAAAIAERVAWAAREAVARRVWERDHTLWAPAPDELADRLGWLTIAERMLAQVDELEAFADEVRGAGFTHCALLGMGGSSLAPEVLRRTFGTAPGYLELHVLDSTHPDAVAGLAAALPLERTLFVVSSKSGGTLEPKSFTAYFQARVSDPRQFVAITDPATALADLAAREGWRRTFHGDPEIGGRYSALSAFGLVPAALLGVDLRALLERALAGAAAAAPELPVEESPPLWLGLALGSLARAGRDKLTFVIDDPLASLGLWLEQLVAESTGKRGTGIVPIADEPLGDPGAYGPDRVFVHLRSSIAPDAAADARLEALGAAGHPVLTVPFGEPTDVAGAFFGWEFAIAVAGAVLGINPFDQPNVQEAKDLTVQTIDAYVRDGGFAPEEPDAVAGQLAVYGAPGAVDVRAALATLLGAAAPPAYVPILAYVPPSAGADSALAALRAALRDARRCATTAGYGPRYLHSTGQLHKGGPQTGRFLEITSDGAAGVEVPGTGYDFAALVTAQATGDLQALRGRGLPALRVHVAGDVVAGLRQLADAVADAVR